MVVDALDLAGASAAGGADRHGDVRVDLRTFAEVDLPARTRRETTEGTAAAVGGGLVGSAMTHLPWASHSVKRHPDPFIVQCNKIVESLPHCIMCTAHRVECGRRTKVEEKIEAAAKAVAAPVKAAAEKAEQTVAPAVNTPVIDTKRSPSQDRCPSCPQGAGQGRRSRQETNKRAIKKIKRARPAARAARVKQIEGTKP